jgi:hypothetical protein
MDPYPFAVWTKSDVGSNWKMVSWNAAAAFPTPGKYLVQLHPTYGDAVEIRKVGVMDANGVWLSVDGHAAAAGLTTFRTIYRLDIVNAKRVSVLCAELRIPNGVASEGEIYIDFVLQ